MELLKEFLINIPQGFVSGLILNGSIILLTYYLVWKRFKKRLQNWRIQLKERFDNKQLKRELKNSFFALLVGATFSSIVILLSTRGLTKIYTDVSDHNIFFSMAGFFILLVIDDTWFYWTHRLLHHPRLYKYVHREHHKSIDVNPFTSMSFHFLEPALLSAWIFPVSFIFPIYAPVLLLLQIWGLLDNIKAHLGYELYPAWWNKSKLGFLTSSTHHNMHHSKFNGNYGLHFRFWDRLMGTEFKEYEIEYDKIQKRKKKKPTKQLLITLFLFSCSGLFSQTNISGEWQDIDHPEKVVKMYIGSDSLFYGKNTEDILIFKSLLFEHSEEVFKGFIVDPKDEEEFDIEILMDGPDIFTFEIKKFIFTRKFEFRRVRH